MFKFSFKIQVIKNFFNIFTLYYSERKVIRKLNEALFCPFITPKKLSSVKHIMLFSFQVPIYICISKLFIINTFLTLAYLKIIKFHFSGFIQKCKC